VSPRAAAYLVHYVLSYRRCIRYCGCNFGVGGRKCPSAIDFPLFRVTDRNTVAPFILRASAGSRKAEKFTHCVTVICTRTGCTTLSRGNVIVKKERTFREPFTESTLNLVHRRESIKTVAEGTFRFSIRYCDVVSSGNNIFIFSAWHVSKCLLGVF